MNCSEEFLTNFMIHIEFPKKAQDVFLRLYQRIQGDTDCSKRLFTLSDLFMNREYEKALMARKYYSEFVITPIFQTKKYIKGK